MPNKISRKGLIKKLDSIVSKIVIDRDSRCMCCGTTNQLTAGHLFSRRGYSTRWDLDNVYAQCWPCNYKQKVTGDPYPLMNYAIKKHGQKLIDELHRRYVTPHKFKTYELELLYQNLEKENL